MEKLKDMEEFKKKFKVGDKITRNNIEIEEVLYIGNRNVFLRDEDGDEWTPSSLSGWQLYQEPKKTVKMYKWAWKSVKGEWWESVIFFESEKDLLLGYSGDIKEVKCLDYTETEFEV